MMSEAHVGTEAKCKWDVEEEGKDQNYDKQIAIKIVCTIIDNNCNVRDRKQQEANEE